MTVDKDQSVYYHNVQMPKNISLPEILAFEWDSGNLEHIKKHNVKYEECEEIFYDESILINVDVAHSVFEKRMQALGQTNKGRKLFIAFTIRENKIRVISARDQNKKEREKYRETGGERIGYEKLKTNSTI